MQTSTIQLMVYIKELKSKGYPDEQIRVSLVSRGYDANLVDTYLRRV